MTVIEDATVTSKGQVTIPQRIREVLDIEAGTELEFVVEDDGSLRVQPKKPAMDRLQEVRDALAGHDVDLEEWRRESKRAWSSHDGEAP